MVNAPDNTGHYKGSILENIRDQVQAIAEAVSGLTSKVNLIDKRLSKVESQTALIPGLQLAISDLTKDFNGFS